MQPTVTRVDYAPDELHEQVPVVVTLLRQIDASVLNDSRLEFAKCAYVAIGVCDVTSQT